MSLTPQRLSNKEGLQSLWLEKKKTNEPAGQAWEQSCFHSKASTLALPLPGKLFHSNLTFHEPYFDLLM